MLHNITFIKEIGTTVFSEPQWCHSRLSLILQKIPYIPHFLFKNLKFSSMFLYQKYWAGWLAYSPLQGQEFFLHHMSRTVLRPPPQASIQPIPVVTSLGIK
jgi:hypothetical protein